MFYNGRVELIAKIIHFFHLTAKFLHAAKGVFYNGAILLNCIVAPEVVAVPFAPDLFLLWQQETTQMTGAFISTVHDAPSHEAFSEVVNGHVVKAGLLFVLLAQAF